MNKALHHFYLFALNRLAEARRGANRGLSLIALTLLIPTSLSAATFSYWGSPGNFTAVFSTAKEVCDYFYSDMHWPHLKSRYMPEANGYTSPTSYQCAMKYSYGGFKQYFGWAWKYSKSCNNGESLDYKTGKCAFLPQKGTPPPLACKGNPINVSNGNKFQAEVDFPGNSVSTLNFSRTYNSLDGIWRHNHSTYLRLAGDAITLVMADGREALFIVSGSTVTGPPAESGRLAKVADSWLYKAKNNEAYSFDATGRLTRWTNASGAEQQLTYANGQVTVTDILGQSLTFTEDAQHQPLTLTTSALTIQYSYNANQRLIQITRTRGGQTEQRQFHYEDARNNALLTGITDESGVRYATWVYDDKDRAISSEHAGGVEHTDVAYNADGSSTVTNEFGKKSTYRFVAIDGVKHVSAIEGEPSANCPNSNSTFTYDERGLLKTKTDNKGHLTTYDYNERGLEVSRTEASGTPQARTITTEWHPEFFLPVTVTEPGRVTRYQYDDQGRSLGQTIESL